VGDGPIIPGVVLFFALTGGWAGKMQVFLLCAVWRVPIRRWMAFLLRSVRGALPYVLPVGTMVFWLQETEQNLSLVSMTVLFLTGALAVFGMMLGLKNALIAHQVFDAALRRWAVIWGRVVGAGTAMFVTAVFIIGVGG